MIMAMTTTIVINVLFRNKKHHYRELSDPVREAYGSMPDGFIHHWMSRYSR